MKKKTIILLWLVTAYSCSNYSSRLKAVLDYSGTNRAELEKVLDHYSQDPAESKYLSDREYARSLYLRRSIHEIL